MAFLIKLPPVIGHQQTDTLHVTSRSEQRKTMQPKAPSGSFKILLFQAALFMGFLIGGGLLLWYSSKTATAGFFFAAVALLFFAVGSLFWLIPNYKAWKRSRKK